MTASLAANVFTESKWQEVQRLVETLDKRQMLWLSGYLAAQELPSADKQQAKSTAPEVLIAFGGETGNGEKLAHQLAALANKQSIPAVVKDLSTLRARQLKKYPYVLVICSTHGDGDPPEPITGFYTSLMDAQADRLPGTKYAVLSLGDSSYEHFCATGKQLDERLASLGATRLTFRQDCDVDFAATAKQWMELVLKTLPRGESTSTNISTPSSQKTEKQTRYSKDSPLAVKVLDNICLSSSDRRNPIHHLELSLEADDFVIEPGDAVGVQVRNPASRVEAVLKAANLSYEQIVTINHRTISLGQALTEECDLTIVSKNFLGAWTGISTNKDLIEQWSADSKEQRNFLRSHQLIDLLTTYPATTDAQSFVDSLRPLQPRLYDVANSPRLVDDELHLTVKQYTYSFQNREETGIASDYLIKLQKNDILHLYPHRNARFHLPEGMDMPLILIADGTGIAPFRAFIQEIQESERTHPCWLVFSEESFEEDFLYQLEWQQALEQGLLGRVDTLFHREQPNRTLADSLTEHPELLTSWLKAGTHLYLCGDKDRLTECENTLQAWAEQSGNEGYWKNMNTNKHIHRNLY